MTIALASDCRCAPHGCSYSSACLPSTYECQAPAFSLNTPPQHGRANFIFATTPIGSTDHHASTAWPLLRIASAPFSKIQSTQILRFDVKARALGSTARSYARAPKFWTGSAAQAFRYYLAIVCDNNVLTGAQEAESRVVKHSVFGVDTVERMLQFIYRGEYETKSAPEDETRGTCGCRFEPTWQSQQEERQVKETSIYHSISCMSTYQSRSFEELRWEDYTANNLPSVEILEQHVFAYAIGDYYELQDLKTLAFQQFQGGKSTLFQATSDQLVHIIEAIYGNTPSSDELLRYEILAFCIDEKKALLKDGWFAQSIADHPELQEFTAEFLLGLSHRHQEDLEDEQKSHLKVVETLQADIQDLSKKLETVRGNAALLKEKALADHQSLTHQLKCAQDNAGVLKAATDGIMQRLSRDLQNARASLAAAQNNPSNKIANQLAEFSAIKFCRHCGEDFEYYLARDGLQYVARCVDCTTRHYSSIVI